MRRAHRSRIRRGSLRSPSYHDSQRQLLVARQTVIRQQARKVVGLVWKNALRMPPKENPPWLFGILAMAYGGVNAITTLLIPFLLRRRGVPVNQIADVVAVSYIPNAWYFLWSPVVDLGMLRRTW